MNIFENFMFFSKDIIKIHRDSIETILILDRKEKVAALIVI